MQNYDGLNIGDLITADYVKEVGEANSLALDVIYRLVYRDDLSAQDMGVINNGVSDTSQVFEVKERFTNI